MTTDRFLACSVGDSEQLGGCGEVATIELSRTMRTNSELRRLLAFQSRQRFGGDPTEICAYAAQRQETSSRSSTDLLSRDDEKALFQRFDDVSILSLFIKQLLIATLVLIELVVEQLHQRDVFSVVRFARLNDILRSPFECHQLFDFSSSYFRSRGDVFPTRTRIRHWTKLCRERNSAGGETKTKKLATKRQRKGRARFVAS